MLGLGFGEIILILVVALLVLGPEKLPGLTKQVGTGLREFRRFANEFQRNLNDIETEAKRIIEDPPATVEQPQNPPPDESEATVSEAETVSRTPVNSTDAS